MTYATDWPLSRKEKEVKLVDVFQHENISLSNELAEAHQELKAQRRASLGSLPSRNTPHNFSRHTPRATASRAATPPRTLNLPPRLQGRDSRRSHSPGFRTLHTTAYAEQSPAPSFSTGVVVMALFVCCAAVWMTRSPDVSVGGYTEEEFDDTSLALQLDHMTLHGVPFAHPVFDFTATQDDSQASLSIRQGDGSDMSFQEPSQDFAKPVEHAGVAESSMDSEAFFLEAPEVARAAEVFDETAEVAEAAEVARAAMAATVFNEGIEAAANAKAADASKAAEIALAVEVAKADEIAETVRLQDLEAVEAQARKLAALEALARKEAQEQASTDMKMRIMVLIGLVVGLGLGFALWWLALRKKAAVVGAPLFSAVVGATPTREGTSSHTGFAALVGATPTREGTTSHAGPLLYLPDASPLRISSLSWSPGSSLWSPIVADAEPAGSLRRAPRERRCWRSGALSMAGERDAPDGDDVEVIASDDETTVLGVSSAKKKSQRGRASTPEPSQLYKARRIYLASVGKQDGGLDSGPQPYPFKMSRLREVADREVAREVSEAAAADAATRTRGDRRVKLEATGGA